GRRTGGAGTARGRAGGSGWGRSPTAAGTGPSRARRRSPPPAAGVAGGPEVPSRAMPSVRSWAAMYTGLTGVCNTAYTGAAMNDFRFRLGPVTLGFLASLGGRAGSRIERLAVPRDLSRWIAGAGMAGAPSGSAEVAADGGAVRG